MGAYLDCFSLEGNLSAKTHLAQDPILNDVLNIFLVGIDQSEGCDVGPTMTKGLKLNHVKVLEFLTKEIEKNLLLNFGSINCSEIKNGRENTLFFINRGYGLSGFWAPGVKVLPKIRVPTDFKGLRFLKLGLHSV